MSLPWIQLKLLQTLETNEKNKFTLLSVNIPVLISSPVQTWLHLYAQFVRQQQWQTVIRRRAAAGGELVNIIAAALIEDLQGSSSFIQQPSACPADFMEHPVDASVHIMRDPVK